MSRVRTFFAFWYDFVVGDDWRIAAGVTVALATTFALATTTTIPAWWVLPTAVAILLLLSLWQAARRGRTGGPHDSADKAE